MEELQKFTGGITLSGGMSREKNLYKLQCMFCPQLYEKKTVDEIKKELQRNTILFCTTSDEDFIHLLKLSIEIYIIDKQDAQKVIFNGEYIIKLTKLLKYMRKYKCDTFLQLREYIKANVRESYWEECENHIIKYIVRNDKPARDENGVEDPIEFYRGCCTVDDLEFINL